MKKILNQLSTILPIVGVVGIMSLASLTIMPSTVNAASTDEGILGGANSAKTEDQNGGLFEDGGIFQTITNTLLFLLGAISVIMLVYGGFRYATSGGNQDSVNAAKNTILYAVVGIVVALIAFAVVQWVIGAIGGSS